MSKTKKDFKKQSDILSNTAIVLFPLIILVTVLVYLGFHKEVWFCDEVFSYCSSNGINKEMPLLSGEWVSGKDINDYLAATSIKEPSLRSIYIKLFDDHVPLYFWVFRFFSLLFMGSCTKWIGLSLNICLCFFAYFLIYKYFRKYIPASIGTASFLAAAILLHPISASELTVLRMYFMFSFFQFAVIYIVSEEDTGFKKYVLLTVATLGGLLTHFYFWFWIAFFSIVYLLFSLTEKGNKIRESIKYLLSMLSALLTATLLFPIWINNIFFSDNKGKTALNNMMNLKTLGASAGSALKTVLKLIAVKKQYEIPLAVLFIAVVLYYCVRIKKNNKIIIPVIGSSLLHAIFIVYTQPSQEERYLWPSSTVLIFIFIFMATAVIKSIIEKVLTKKPNKKNICKILPLFLSVLLLCGGINLSCDFENLEFFKRRPDAELEAIKDSSAYPWIVFADAKDWEIHWSLYDFLIPEKVKTVSPQQEPYPDDILAQSNTVIVYTYKEKKEIDDCVEYIEKSGNSTSTGYEKIATTFTMDVYKVYLETK